MEYLFNTFSRENERVGISLLKQKLKYMKGVRESIISVYGCKNDDKTSWFIDFFHIKTTG